MTYTDCMNQALVCFVWKRAADVAHPAGRSATLHFRPSRLLARLLQSLLLGRLLRSRLLARLLQSRLLARLLRSPLLARLLRSPLLARLLRSLSEPTTSSTTPEPTTSSTTPEPTTSSTTPESTTSSTTPEQTTSSTTPESTTSSTTPEPTTSSTTPEPTTSSTTPEPTTSTTTPQSTTTPVLTTTREPDPCPCAVGFYKAAGNCTQCPDNTVSVRGSAALTDCRCAPGAIGHAGGPCYYPCESSCVPVNVGNFEFTDVAMYTRQTNVASSSFCNSMCIARKNCVAYSYRSTSKFCDLGGCKPGTGEL
jgi:hypothetical protein